MATRLRHLWFVLVLATNLGWRCGAGGDSEVGVDAGAADGGASADAGTVANGGAGGDLDGGRDGGGVAGGIDAPCQMPSSQAGCVKIGGGVQPWYYEGWFCPSGVCAGRFCAASELGVAGRCGASAAEIRDIVSSGEGKVLEGTLP